MSNLSLQKSIQGCKVVTDWAIRQQSDRFLNSDNLLCPLWNGIDLTGRPVCPDSFNTKVQGCSNPLDRVMVENEQRPKYFQYITLNASGLEGGSNESTANRSQMLKNYAESTPSYGQNLNRQIGSGGCAVNSYDKSITQSSEEYRQQQEAQHRYNNNQIKQWSGM